MQSVSRQMRVSSLLSIAGVLALAACSDGTRPNERQFNYAIITIGDSAVTGGFRARPSAVFYRFAALTLPSSISASDSCGLIAIGGTSSGQRPHFLNAGDSVRVDLNGTDTFLRPDTTAPDFIPFYGVREGPGPVYTPGSNVTFYIPGSAGGYPADTVTAKTAEAFTLNPVLGNPLPADDLPLSWSPAGDGSSKMIITLQYASVGSNRLNQAVYCSLADDGAVLLPATLINGWRNAQGGLRKVEASRWRTKLQQKAHSVALVIATFDVVGSIALNP